MRKTLTFAATALALMALILFASIRFFSFKPQYRIQTLSRGWTVTYHNQQYLNTNLESLSKELNTSFSRGDIVTLNQTRTLQELDVPFPYLFVKTQHCAYEVSLDGEPIETAYMDRLTDSEFIGIGYNYIPLPEDYAGRHLTITLHVAENSTRADIITPMIGNFDDLYRQLLHSTMFALVVGIFMMVFGAVFLLISLLFYIRAAGVSSQIICSLLTVDLGLWLLTAYDITDFVLPMNTSTFLEYCALYLITPLLLMIVMNLHPRSNNRVLMILIAATLCFDVVFVLFHVFGVVHINHFQYPSFMLSLLGVLMLGAYIHMDIKSRSTGSTTRILMTGVTVLSASLVVYAVFSAFKVYVDYRQSALLKLILPAGSLFFVVMQLLNYFIFMAHSFAQKKEYAALSKIAYVDNLTGLPNRASCDEAMLKFDASQDEFCLLSLDLNGLKEVNDNSGHPAGDRLLKSFADALQETFRGVGTCGRTGGDEFLVLIRSITKEEIDVLLKNLDERLLQLDEEDQEINHSVSYGYAFRSETKERDTHSVFMLADKRMYDFKREHYAHMMHR